MRKEWNENTIGRVFGIIDEALYSMALYSEINPSERDNTIFDPYLRKFWQTICFHAVGEIFQYVALLWQHRFKRACF